MREMITRSPFDPQPHCASPGHAPEPVGVLVGDSEPGHGHLHQAGCGDVGVHWVWTAVARRGIRRRIAVGRHAQRAQAAVFCAEDIQVRVCVGVEDVWVDAWVGGGAIGGPGLESSGS